MRPLLYLITTALLSVAHSSTIFAQSDKLRPSFRPGLIRCFRNGTSRAVPGRQWAWSIRGN
ncbi:hypothetical protein [Dyadobacter chenhuakuii]|uniref:Uncharacterized protein n=1 Tax=Dyadobacter chenhuakuii TaxID=2909339 RepID=A0A9X1QDG8_9BACT|nr:hypothetical protein [Dyadobacter chenhuakuii]MCF2499231.1 hypothetical protein [Dyadobacter chenhuakuii]